MPPATQGIVCRIAPESEGEDKKPSDYPQSLDGALSRRRVLVLASVRLPHEREQTSPANAAVVGTKA